MNYEAIKTLKDQVEYVLREVPNTRNSDILLTVEIWRRWYPTRVHQTELGAEYVYTSDLLDLPREDNVKRARAHFQNTKGLYLPTSWEVAKKRGLAEDEWRVAMGYPTKSGDYTPPSRTVDRF